jgi:hypothetical protein
MDYCLRRCLIAYGVVLLPTALIAFGVVGWLRFARCQISVEIFVAGIVSQGRAFLQRHSRQRERRRQPTPQAINRQRRRHSTREAQLTDNAEGN